MHFNRRPCELFCNAPKGTQHKATTGASLSCGPVMTIFVFFFVFQLFPRSFSTISFKFDSLELVFHLLNIYNWSSFSSISCFEFQPFNRSYSQLTFFNVYTKYIYIKIHLIKGYISLHSCQILSSSETGFIVSAHRLTKITLLTLIATL